MSMRCSSCRNPWRESRGYLDRDRDRDLWAVQEVRRRAPSSRTRIDEGVFEVGNERDKHVLDLERNQANIKRITLPSRYHYIILSKPYRSRRRISRINSSTSGSSESLSDSERGGNPCNSSSSSGAEVLISRSICFERRPKSASSPPPISSKSPVTSKCEVEGGSLLSRGSQASLCESQDEREWAEFMRSLGPGIDAVSSASSNTVRRNPSTSSRNRRISAR